MYGFKPMCTRAGVKNTVGCRADRSAGRAPTRCVSYPTLCNDIFSHRGRTCATGRSIRRDPGTTLANRYVENYRFSVSKSIAAVANETRPAPEISIGQHSRTVFLRLFQIAEPQTIMFFPCGTPMNIFKKGGWTKHDNGLQCVL